ncbi:hypothetical protein [uncultured Pseudoteredinibacter sp.]|uniref:hypothetical protein n=1 Tax=uncultured Pseudoteredinibacter sp. TaxID=1641701 RepID=UPI00262EB8C4|nr:hypothetical protein [uncultured Pseudoteredinibacter sp.]
MKRAEARYEALMKKDQAGLAKAWEYTTPSFRGYTTVEQYAPKVAGRMFWSAVEPRGAECEEDVCEVTFNLTYKPPQLNVPITRPLKNKWLFIDGEWWIYHK